MDEEIKPPEMPTTDITKTVEVMSDNRTLMGTVLQNVFGNYEVMLFIVSVMVLVTLLIISTDFMRWKGRE